METKARLQLYTLQPRWLPLSARAVNALLCSFDVLGGALRPLVSGVSWERYLPDVTRVDGAEKSRLDLVVKDPEHPGMLDVVVFQPIQPCGKRLYRHLDHERLKFSRYQPSRDGRRQHTLPLIPMVLSTFGVLNDTGRE